MSAQAPEDPEQIRGETLTPVSPKPLHYPSPSNIPILELSMDPAFSETVTETMQQQAPEPLPSTAQHTIPITSVDPTLAEPALTANEAPDDTRMADDESQGDRVDAGAESARASMSDPLSGAQETPSLGPQSFPSEPQPSETQQDTSAVDTSPSEEISIDVSAATAAASQPAESSSVGTDLNIAQLVAPPNGADGSIDYSAILASLSNVIAGATPTPSAQVTPIPIQASSAVISPPPALASNPNLPPKPPAQEKPSIHPNYVPGDDLRNYHPHTQKDNGAAFQSSNLPNLSTSGLPPPPHTYQTPQSAAPASVISAHAPPDDEDAPFDSQTQALYDAFIAFERQNVHEGQWDKFPMGSRLFVGNLSTEKVQKKDVFRKFFRYGQIAQISLKQAYGFVQFMDAATCATALAMEQATKIRGREIHLEVSKPAKSTNRGQDRTRRRSRSPDYGRGGAGGRIDRYSGSPRDRDNRRSRDEWRRSPSPRRGYGGRDDRYDGRRRRSPSPYGARDRYTAQPPRDELDLPWRSSDQVPDVQILVVDQIDHEYIRWVDNAMKSRGIRVDVLILQPRWPEEAVVRRQILEGVIGVVHLYRADRMKNKVPLRLFNRSAGVNNVSFDQYVDLDPITAADLVLRAKQSQPQPQTAPPPPPHQYSHQPPHQHNPPPAQQYGSYQPRGPPPAAIPPPSANRTDMSHIMSSFSAPSSVPPPGSTTNQDLARIMAGMGSQQGGRPGSTGITPDVARLLGQMGQPPPPQQGHPLPGAYQTPQPGGGQAVQPPNPQSGTDIQQLLANLTNYKAPS